MALMHHLFCHTFSNHLRRGIFIVLFAFISFLSVAQYSPYKQANSLNSKLSSDKITALLQDKSGYLWIATKDGLNKYDGYSFTVYKNIPGDSTSIGHNEVRALAVDSAGNVWVGSEHGQLSYYQPLLHTFINLDAPQMGLAADDIKKIFFDSSNRLWVTISKHGLYYLDKKLNRFIKAGDLPDIHHGYQVMPIYYQAYNTIYDIYEDAKGLFWLATHDGLYTFDPKSNSFKSVRQKAIVPFEDRTDLFNTILPSKNGFWFSSWGGGLTFYNTLTGEWKNYLINTGFAGTHNIILGMDWKTEEEELWVASTDRGFGYFDIKKEKFTFLNPQRCEKILKDKRGMMWVTSETEGLLQFDPLSLISYQKVNVTRTDNGLYFYTNGFYHDVPNGLLYYGAAFGDGLHVVDEKKEKEIVHSFDVLPMAEQILFVSTIYKDDRDTLWVLTNDYIYWMDQKKQQLRKFIQPFDQSGDLKKVITPEFYRMIRAANGDLWFTSLSTGVYRYRSGKFIHYTKQGLNSISSNTVTAIEQDSYGRVWMIAEGSLSLYSYEDNSFHGMELFTNENPELGKVIFSDLTKGLNGDLWFTSSAGIYQYDHRYRSNKLIHWSADNGIPLGKAKYIKVDRKGLVWFLTSSYLWCLDPVAKKIIHSIAVQMHFNSECLYIDTENHIFLGAYGGYNLFDTKNQIKTSTAPPLLITSFDVNHKELLIDSMKEKKINLNYDQNTITIKFAALDFRNPAQNKYSFILEGADDRWTSNTELRLANYMNLSPGDYTFKVKAATMDGIWSDPVVIRLHIDPPFWATWQAVTASILIVIYSVFLLSRWRISRVRKEETMKSTLERKILETEMSTLRAQMNPHFIFNSLNSINKYILMADPETASFYLTKFSKLIRLILENSNKTKISLEQELTALKHYIDIELVRFDHSFSYSVQVDDDIDPSCIQFPPLIIQPYVENSIWHGFIRRGNGVLTVTIKKDVSNVLLITIEDNGVGRNFKKNTLETSNKKSHGLKITEDRLSILAKEGHVSSVEIIDLFNERGEPAGTKVMIRLTAVALSPSEDVY